MTDTLEYGFDGDGDYVETDCGECDETYWIFMNLAVTFSTQKQDPRKPFEEETNGKGGL